MNINFEKYDHNAKEVSLGPFKQDQELQFFYCIINSMDALHHIFDILFPIQVFKHTHQFLYVPSQVFSFQLDMKILMILAFKKYGCIFHLQMENLQKLIISHYTFS